MSQESRGPSRPRNLENESSLKDELPFLQTTDSKESVGFNRPDDETDSPRASSLIHQRSHTFHSSQNYSSQSRGNSSPEISDATSQGPAAMNAPLYWDTAIFNTALYLASSEDNPLPAGSQPLPRSLQSTPGISSLTARPSFSTQLSHRKTPLYSDSSQAPHPSQQTQDTRVLFRGYPLVHSSEPPPPEPPEPSGRRLNIKDALTYLDSIKSTLGDRPHVYNRFLDFMRVIDDIVLIHAVANLFHEYPNLILGFNTFLPPGYRIAPSDPSNTNSMEIIVPQDTNLDMASRTPATISASIDSAIARSQETDKTSTGSRCQSRGLPCSIKTFARHSNDGASEPEHLGTQNQYLSTLTPETSRNLEDEIEDRTDGITGLLQLPVLKDRKTSDAQDKSQFESRSTAKEGEGLTRQQHLVLKSNLNPAKSKNLPPKMHIKTESGYSGSSRIESSTSDMIKVKIEDLDSGSEYEENGKDAKPRRKKARIFKEEDTATDIAYWKARVKNNPFRNWDGLVFAYQREFAGMTTNETSSSREGISSNILELEKWLRLDGYEDGSRIEFIDPDPDWFNAVTTLMHLPSSEANRLYLTWEIVQLSRINAFHSLHTLHYNDTIFMRLLNDAFQKYSDSLEFQISFAFAGIASGQYYNGISQLREMCEGHQTPARYKNVLIRAIQIWLDISISPFFSSSNPHDRRPRAVTFQCTIPTQWLGMRDSIYQFEDDSLALLALQSNNQRSAHYGQFQGLHDDSTDTFLAPRVRLDFIGRLVSDYWGSLGKSVISVFRNVLQEVVMTEVYAVEEVLKDSQGSMKIYLAVSVTDVSLVGYTSLAEWNCVISCLKWLIALVGPPRGHLAFRQCSPGQWKLKPIWDMLRNRIPADFRDTVFEMQYVIDEEKMSDMHTVSTIPCWLNMFSGGYIGGHISQNFTYSNTFESTRTWTGQGLKVAFDVLIHAAGVEDIVEVEGSPILCGFRSALIPIGRFEDDSIQWHLIIAKDNEGPFRWIQHRDDFQASLPADRIKNVHIDNLKGTAYLGWHRTGVNVVLGTIDPPVEILRSKLPICQQIHVPSGFQFQLGIQTTNSPVGALLSLTKSYRRCSLAFAIAPPDNFCAIVDQLFSKHVIVYDEGVKAALFCTLINLVLFLVRAYLQNNDYPSDVLKFASSPQHSQSAIRERGDDLIVPGFTFSDAVKVIMHRYSAVYQFIPADLRLTRSDILGFEIRDLLGNNDTFYARKLAIGKGVGPWSMLAKTTDVVFCGGIGRIVSVVDEPTMVQSCSHHVPTGRDILVFPIPLLKSHFDGTEGNFLRQRGRGEFQWEPTASLFNCKFGTQCDGESCWKYRLQCIKKGSGVLKRRRDNGFVAQKLDWMHGDGAICFGYIAEK